MKTANALILDFGGVVTRTMFETHRETEAALGLARGTLAWRGPFAPETDQLWTDMQADEISEREYWRRRTVEVAALVGANWTEMSDFIRAARGADPQKVIRPEALEAIARASKAGCQLAILSNELDLFYGADFRKKLPFLKDFNLIVDATYSGVLKPDPRAYRDCLAQLGTSPENSVFVDDQLRNIAGAEVVGLKTVHFDVREPGASYARALSLLGLKEASHA